MAHDFLVAWIPNSSVATKLTFSAIGVWLGLALAARSRCLDWRFATAAFLASIFLTVGFHLLMPFAPATYRGYEYAERDGTLGGIIGFTLAFALHLKSGPRRHSSNSAEQPNGSGCK